MKTCLVVVMSAAFIGGTAIAAAAQDAAKIEAGKTAYTTQKCGTCHAIKGVGGKVAGALDGVGAKLTADDIKKWLVTPADMEAKLAKKPAMPMAGYMKTHKLTDADVENITAYMVSLKQK